MISYPEPDEVLTDLGDKVVEGFSRAVARTKDDLRKYRETFPSFVSQASERGLSNWIHDRLWYHLMVLLDGLPSVQIYDQEPKREINVGYRYRLRAKRHGQDGSVSTYPTEGAVQGFLFQAQETLSGLEEIRLIAGYVWERETRGMKEPALSLHDGRNKVVWMIPLPGTDTGYGTTPATPITPPVTSEPGVPAIEVTRDDSAEKASGESDAT